MLLFSSKKFVTRILCTLSLSAMNVAEASQSDSPGQPSAFLSRFISQAQASMSQFANVSFAWTEDVYSVSGKLLRKTKLKAVYSASKSRIEFQCGDTKRLYLHDDHEDILLDVVSGQAKRNVGGFLRCPTIQAAPIALWSFLFCPHTAPPTDNSSPWIPPASSFPFLDAMNHPQPLAAKDTTDTSQNISICRVLVKNDLVSNGKQSIKYMKFASGSPWPFELDEKLMTEKGEAFMEVVRVDDWRDIAISPGKSVHWPFKLVFEIPTKYLPENVSQKIIAQVTTIEFNKTYPPTYFQFNGSSVRSIWDENTGKFVDLTGATP